MNLIIFSCLPGQYGCLRPAPGLSHGSTTVRLTKLNGLLELAAPKSAKFSRYQREITREISAKNRPGLKYIFDCYINEISKTEKNYREKLFSLTESPPVAVGNKWEKGGK